MLVSQIMKRKVETCAPDDTLSRAAKKMWDSEIGCLPVLNPSRSVIGIITDRDICMAGYFRSRALSEIPVSVAMTKEVIVCSENDTIAVAEEEMRFHQIRRLPVLSLDGKLVGMLSISDLAREAKRELASEQSEISPEELTDTMAMIQRQGGF